MARRPNRVIWNLVSLNSENVNFNDKSPPFGGTNEDYELLFKTKFNILKLETCYNSVSPRANNELWISMQKTQ